MGGSGAVEGASIAGGMVRFSCDGGTICLSQFIGQGRAMLVGHAECDICHQSGQQPLNSLHMAIIFSSGASCFAAFMRVLEEISPGLGKVLRTNTTHRSCSFWQISLCAGICSTVRKSAQARMRIKKQQINDFIEEQYR